MKPIYVTNRSNLAGWYAFKHPQGTRVVWDGGLTPSANCLYQLDTMQQIHVDWIDELPRVPLVGWLPIEQDRLVAIDSPHLMMLNEMLKLEDVPDGFQTFIALENPNMPAPFYYCLNHLAEMCDRIEVPCMTVLPEDATLAYKKFKEMSAEQPYLVRHPKSPWVPRYHSLYGTSVRPDVVRFGRLKVAHRELSGDVSSLEFWVGNFQIHKCPTLYFKDIDGSDLISRSPFYLYYGPEGAIIGYEKA